MKAIEDRIVDLEERQAAQLSDTHRVEIERAGRDRLLRDASRWQMEPFTAHAAKRLILDISKPPKPISGTSLAGAIDDPHRNRVQGAMAAFQKFATDRPFSSPASGARKLIEIARTLPVDKGRMCVGKWNDRFRAAGGSVDEYAAGRDQAIADGLIEMHECGGFIMFTPTGASPPSTDVEA